jgi:hypothetical protein
VAIYTSTLSMPLLGESPEAILSGVRAALTDDPRVQAMRDELEHPDEDAATEHVSVEVRFSAETCEAAQQIAFELHDAALRRVLALVPPDHLGGWTSSVEHPEPATD